MQTKSVAAALPLGGLVVLLALLDIALWWRLPMHFYGHRWGGDPTIHLVDELLHRVARRDHDISFGLRAVVGQLLGNELPMPDYALSRDRVFRDLTVNLLRLTGSPQIFVAAALKPLSAAAGGPSWVPDWSARPCMIWWQWHYAPYGYSDHKHMEWQIDPEDEPYVVRVQGYRHGTISDIYRFKSTDESYRPAEGDSHLDNLRTMLRLGNMGTSLRLCEFQAQFFTSLLNATTSSSAEEKEKEDMDTQLSDYDVGAYLFFLFLARCEGAARALSWMQPDGGGWATRIMAILSPRSTWSREGLFESMPGFLLNILFSNIKRKLELCFFVLKRRENILRTHARLCNRLAQTDHVAISKSADGQVGICRGSAEVGHQLVQFKNTPLIFVASSSSSDSDDGRIRLVSPSMGLEVRVVDEYRVERLTSLGYDQSRFILDEPKELCVA